MDLDNDIDKEKLKSDECNFTVLDAMVKVYNSMILDYPTLESIHYQINKCLNSRQKYDILMNTHIKSKKLYLGIVNGIEDELLHYNLIQQYDHIDMLVPSLRFIKTPMLIKELCHKGLGNGPISVNDLGKNWMDTFEELKQVSKWYSYTSVKTLTMDAEIQGQYFWFLFSNLTNSYDIDEIKKYVESCIELKRLSDPYGEFILYFLNQRKELLPNSKDFILSTAMES